MRPIKAPGRWASYGGIVVALLVGVLRAQDFTYTNSNGTITITGYIGPGGNVTIPASIEGLAVTAIGGMAFGWTNGLFYLSDPQWKNYSERFYRIRSP